MPCSPPKPQSESKSDSHDRKMRRGGIQCGFHPGNFNFKKGFLTMKRPWAFILCRRGHLFRAPAPLLPHRVRVRVRSRLPAFAGRAVCGARDPDERLINNRLLCVTSCCAAQCWWVCGRDSDATVNAQLGLAKKYSRVCYNPGWDH